MALTYHSGRRGFLGFLTYLTGSDGATRGGVIPAFTPVSSSGVENTGGTASTTFVAVTPSNTVALVAPVSWVRVGVAGNVVLRGPADGADVTIPATAGEYIPVGAGVLVKTSSTATGMIAIG